MRQDGSGGGSCVFPFLQVSQAPVIPQKLRLWLTSFPWEQALLIRTEYSVVFQNGSFSPPPDGSNQFGGGVPSSLLWETGWTPGGKSLNIGGAPLWLGTLIAFNSQSYPHWASSNLSITFQLFLSWYWFLQWFLPLSLCPGKPGLPVVAYLSLQSWGPQFALCLPLSYGSYKSCWFYSLFSFSLVLGWSGNL